MKNQALLETIKREFRHWYGMLSIDEIMLNQNLIQIIERLESHKELQGVGV